MAERSSFFNSINGDRVYNAKDFTSYFNNMLNNGVFKDSTGDGLKVISSGGLNIKVKNGSAFINGYRYENTSDLDLILEESDPLKDRIDLIVVRLNEADRIINVAVKKGVPSTSPIKPNLTVDSVVEIPLASIRVNKGVVSIATSNIEDERLFACSYLDVNHIHKDGHGSESNSDMVDGYHASEFVLKSDCEVNTYNNYPFWQQVKKYSDGRLEIINRRIVDCHVQHPWGSGFSSGNSGMALGDYVIPFIESEPITICSIGSNSSANGVIPVIHSKATETRAPKIDIFRPTAIGVSTFSISCISYGKWK